MQMLAIVLAVLLAATLTAAIFFPELAQRLFRGGIAGCGCRWPPSGRSSSTSWWRCSCCAGGRRRTRTSRASARFANALIETSLPSVIIFALSHHMEPQLVFGFWPPMLYFVFIVLSTLRLDFWLSVWTGAVAAVQQLALAAWLLPLDAAGRRAGARR